MSKSEMTSYKPISCSFHDVLLYHATLKDEVTLVYESGSVRETVQTRIMDIVTIKGEEFLYTSQGKKIRLDRIYSVNDEILGHYC